MTIEDYIKQMYEQLKEPDFTVSISELYDSKVPYLPKGCFSQAWSVAEVLRIIEQG